MPIEEEPIVGATYEDEEGRTFEVLAFDEDEGTIEVQYEDETVKQLDLDIWYETELKRIASPKNEKSADDDDELEDDADDFDDEDEDDDDFDDDEEQ